MTLGPAGRIRVRPPPFRQEQPLVHERITFPGGIARKHPHLTILYFAQRATVLPRDAHGVRPLFDKARLVEHQDPIGLAHLLGDKLMIGPPHVLLIPGDLAEKPLQPTDAPAWDPESHGLDRLACQRAQLAHHIIKEMGARLTPRKTVVKEALELLEFVGEPGHIPRGEIKGGHRTLVVCRPTRW